MKIGILTLALNTNYGGILQAYALQTILERMGHDVVVYNRPNKISRMKWSQFPKRIAKKILGHDIVIFKEWKYNKEASIINRAVWDFREQYIHERIINCFEDINENDVDCFIVGSDQVWRPKYFKEQWESGIEDAFLAFTKGWNIKRIAYSASFGVSNWEYSQKETELCRKASKMFQAISVREKSGMDLTERYLYTKSIQTLDPTLFLLKDDYINNFELKKLSKSKGDLLIYLFEPNKEKRDLINRISKEKKLVPFVVNNTLVKQTSPINKRILPSVESWLRGFYDAQFVVTDSFHACVFSIIFRKPFITLGNIRRGDERFRSLIESLGLSCNFLKNTSDYNSEKDYSIPCNLNNILDDLRRSSLNFLMSNLNN